MLTSSVICYDLNIKKFKCNKIMHEHGHTAAEKIYFFVAIFIENEPILFLCYVFHAWKYFFSRKEENSKLIQIANFANTVESGKKCVTLEKK